jgi:ABC-2 type transport system ATP-binding protein
VVEAIAVEGLTRRFGARVALDGVSFSVGRGEIVGFLGPNGAGKSTTMRILAGALAPDGGTARIMGHDCVTDGLAVRRRLGYLPEAAPVYPEMRVGDYLDFVGGVRGLSEAERARAIARVVEACDLADRVDQRTGELSRGYRQRVGLAQAMLHDPDVLVLDEPTAGLDPNQVAALRAVVRRIGERRTVLLSTHVLQEVQALCDRVLVLHHGRLVADAPVARLQEVVDGRVAIALEVVHGAVRLGPAALRSALASLSGVCEVEDAVPTTAGAVALRLVADRDVRAEVFDLAVSEGVRVVALGLERRSLEDVFRSLTADEGAPAQER